MNLSFAVTHVTDRISSFVNIRREILNLGGWEGGSTNKTKVMYGMYDIIYDAK